MERAEETPPWLATILNLVYSDNNEEFLRVSGMILLFGSIEYNIMLEAEKMLKYKPRTPVIAAKAIIKEIENEESTKKESRNDSDIIKWMRNALHILEGGKSIRNRTLHCLYKPRDSELDDIIRQIGKEILLRQKVGYLNMLIL